MIKNHLQPVGEGEYSDYPCSELCGCDRIPKRDNCLVNRHHFHYRNPQNKIQWCCLTEPVTSERLPADFVALKRPIEEINWMLERTYFKSTSILATLLLSDYTPRSFEPQQFSLQLHSLLVAREYFRQVLSTLNLPICGVLSPTLFAIFIDDIVNCVVDSKTGCCISVTCVSMFVYADDIVLIAPTIDALQKIINIVGIPTGLYRYVYKRDKILMHSFRS